MQNFENGTTNHNLHKFQSHLHLFTSTLCFLVYFWQCKDWYHILKSLVGHLMIGSGEWGNKGTSLRQVQANNTETHFIQCLPLTPVSSQIFFISFSFLISPLAITGTDTLSFNYRIQHCIITIRIDPCDSSQVGRQNNEIFLHYNRFHFREEIKINCIMFCLPTRVYSVKPVPIPQCDAKMIFQKLNWLIYELPK